MKYLPTQQFVWRLMLLALLVVPMLCQAAVEVDVALSYSPDAASRQGGEDNIQVNLANALAGANADHDRSGTGVRLRIAGFYQSTNNPVSVDNTAVCTAVSSGSAYQDVRNFGASVGADLVSYYSYSTGAAGNAGQPGMYSAMGEQWIYHLVVSHELGHNLGCDHRDGHLNPKTIMLHNYCGGGAQGWFSNPQIWLNGVQLLGGDSCLGAGVAGGDNAAVIAGAAQSTSDNRSRVVAGPDLNDVVLRWLFTNAPGSAPAGTTVADSASGTNLATVLGNGAMFTNNALRLPGGASGSSAAYLQLPGGIISSLTNVTIELWATPLSVQSWGRVMDFNNGTANYITLSSSIGTDLNSQRFESKINGPTVTLDSGLATAAGVQHHYAITFADNGSGGGRWTWYRDGDQVAWLDVAYTLSALQDVNNWLGRSAYSGDAFANCEYAEVRISTVAMSRGPILANYQLGPNYVPAVVTLTNSDAYGATSFNAAGNWGNGAAPSAGNSYETYSFQLRTPATSSSYTFGGTKLGISGGSLVYKGTAGSTITVPNLVLNNGTVLNGSGPACTLAGGLSATTNGGTINGAYGRPINITANLSGSGPLTFLSGPTTLSGNNSAFTGQMFVGNGVAGTVVIDSPSRLGAVPATFTSDQLAFNRGTLQTSATMTLSNNNRGILLDISGGTFSVASGTTLTLASTLSSPAGANPISGSLTKTGSGTLVLCSPSNTFTGTLYVDTGGTGNDGVVRVASSQVLASAHSPININNNNAGSSTLQLDGTAGAITLPQWIALSGRNSTVPAIENLAGTNSINGMALYGGGANYAVQSDAGLLTFNGLVQSGISGSRTLTFQGNGDVAITSTLQNGAATPLNLVKAGTGSLTLSGPMTYTGATTVNGGLLRVNTTTGAGGVTVVSSGTLGGNGIIGGAVTVQSGGTIAPGTSPGVLTVSSNVTLNVGSATLMKISKTALTNDQLRVAGVLTYGGTLTVTNLGGTLALGDSFDLFNAAGSVGSFTAVNLPPLGAGLGWSFNPVNGVLSVVSSGNTPPTISSVANQTVDENVPTAALAVTVGDAETAAGSLILSGTSSNPALVPAGNLVFGGSGSNRTVTIRPALNQYGSATITLAVSDGALVTTTSFLLTVNFVNQPPAISPIADQTANPNTLIGPLAFSISDPETAPDALLLSASSSNPTLVPTNNIVFGGSGNNRTLTLTPAADQTGVSTITLTVSDGALSASTSFRVAVKAIATYSKADNALNLNLAGSWTGGGVPDAAAIAVWDSTVTSANTVALGANLSWNGVVISNPAGPVTLTAGNTLTLGASGIDLSAASQNLTINSGLALAAANQSWDVASGRTLAVAGTFTRATPGATLVIGGDTGTVAFSPPLSNSIVGPWAFVSRSGTAGNNSAAGYTYATVSGGNIVPYMLASNVTTFGWTSGNPGTMNYDVAGVQGNLGVARTANTVRYTGAAGTQNWGNNNTTAVTLNGLLNAGSGTLTFAQSGGSSFGQVKAGANNELVLHAASAGIVIAIPVLDGSAASALTICSAGTNAVVLSGANLYSGNTTVNGNLQLGAANAIPAGSGKGNVSLNGTLDLNGFSQAINGLSGAGTVDNTSATAATVTLGSNNASSTFSGVIKNSGGTVTLVKTGTGALTLAGNNTFSGGVTVQNAAGTLNVNSPSALGSGTLNLSVAGAIVNNTSGSALTVPNALTVSANFTFGGSSDLAFGGPVNLGSLAKTITTAAGTLALNGVVSGRGAFTKSGAGTLVLSGANPFSGTTAVSAGTLLINGSAGTNTVTVASGASLGGKGTIGGLVMVQPGGTLAPGVGASLNVLTLGVPPVLNGGTIMKLNRTNALTADLLSISSGTLALSGTLTVTNIGPALQAGDTFQLFSATSFSGSFANLSLPPLDGGLVWNFDPTSGVLRVLPAVATAPTTLTYTTGQGNVTLSWPSDYTGWRLQVQTNTLAMGLGTNWFTVPASQLTNQMAFPVSSGNSSVFFRLVYP